MQEDKEDAFGHEIHDHYNGKGGYEIIERDDGYIEISGGPEAYFLEFDNWIENQKEAMYYVEGKILDIGVGAGKHSLYLQKNGFDVLGIDLSPLAINVCISRGLKKAEVLSLHNIGKELGIFDTILMLGNNFSLFGNPNNAKRTLKIFHEITSENGRIIAETRDPYQTDKIEHLEYHELNRKRGRMSGQITIRVRYKKYVTSWLDLLFVSKKEMKEIIANTGWKISSIIQKEGEPHYIAIIDKEKI